jgi:hypothetical protein
MEPITREQMRNLKAETDRINRRETVRRWVHSYYAKIKQVASSTTETKHFINTNEQQLGKELCDDIVIELRTLFPGCLVEYRETRNMNNRVIESGILVEWS